MRVTVDFNSHQFWFPPAIGQFITYFKKLTVYFSTIERLHIKQLYHIYLRRLPIQHGVVSVMVLSIRIKTACQVCIAHNWRMHYRLLQFRSIELNMNNYQPSTQGTNLLQLEYIWGLFGKFVEFGHKMFKYRYTPFIFWNITGGYIELAPHS